MDRLMVLSSSRLQVECLYYGYEKEKAIRKQRFLSQGDIIELKNNCRFIPGIGWYVQVLINNIENEYILLNTIEAALMENKLAFIVDLEIELNVLSFQLNKALDDKNSTLFFTTVKRLNELNKIKHKAETHLLNIK
ncbi:hypothetical protein ACJ2A9_06240 [Anaerobacillus sp. MEB173]|uniref:hypothetical protein n=1 Tax=Anaerobacillus sp. MEB173 TaxID=3383345 RepID=UPI003F939EE2